MLGSNETVRVHIALNNIPQVDMLSVFGAQYSSSPGSCELLLDKPVDVNATQVQLSWVLLDAETEYTFIPAIYYHYGHCYDCGLKQALSEDGQTKWVVLVSVLMAFAGWIAPQFAGMRQCPQCSAMQCNAGRNR